MSRVHDVTLRLIMASLVLCSFFAATTLAPVIPAGNGPAGSRANGLSGDGDGDGDGVWAIV